MMCKWCIQLSTADSLFSLFVELVVVLPWLDAECLAELSVAMAPLLLLALAVMLLPIRFKMNCSVIIRLIHCGLASQNEINKKSNKPIPLDQPLSTKALSRRMNCRHHQLQSDWTRQREVQLNLMCWDLVQFPDFVLVFVCYLGMAVAVFNLQSKCSVHMVRFGCPHYKSNMDLRAPFQISSKE